MDRECQESHGVPVRTKGMHPNFSAGFREPWLGSWGVPVESLSLILVSRT